MTDTQTAPVLFETIPTAGGQVFGRATLNALFTELQSALASNGIRYEQAAVYRDFRPGDVRHSQADIGKAQRLLGYAPQFDLQTGVAKAMPWYIRFLK